MEQPEADAKTTEEESSKEKSEEAPVTVTEAVATETKVDEPQPPAEPKAAEKPEEKPAEGNVEKKAVEEPDSPAVKKRKIEDAPPPDLEITPIEPEKVPEVPADIDLPPKQTLGKGKRARIPNKRYSDIILSPISRSHKPTLENGEKADDGEDGATTGSPATKRAKISIDVNSPTFRKPFNFGWKRELVYKASSEPNKKIVGDIYYYTPNGKKLRSLKEVGENLTTKELTIDNFTFAKEVLGVNDPEKEIVRDAKVTHKNAGGKAAVRTPKVLSPKVATPRTAPGKLQSPKAGKTDTPPESLSPKSRPSTRNAGTIKAPQPKGSAAKGKQDKKSKSEEEPAEAEVTGTKRPVRKTATKLSNNLAIQPCSIRCQGVSGMVPTLHCQVCLCLYHYECVGLSPHVQVEGYVCKNCQLEHGQNVGTSASISLPPLTPINTLKTLTSQTTILPKLQRIPRSGDSPQSTDGGGGAATPGLPPVIPTVSDRAVTPQPPQRTKAESKGLVGGLTSWLPHSSTIQVDNLQRNKENEPLEAPRPQYVEYLGGRKFLVIPKHNVVSISPASNLKMPQQLQKKLTDESGEPVNGAEFEESVGRGADGETTEATPIVDAPKSKRRGVKSNSITSEKVEELKFMENFPQNLCFGYNSLLYVFQYLKVQDLLRAGCVCTMWRDVASHPSLWRTVRMKNSQVHSFDGLAETLKRHGTIHLDLRKMLLPANGGDDIWPEFAKAIEKVKTLRKIELCRCPANVIEQLANTNKELEVISATAIKCETMSLDQLSSLKDLKELRIKSTSGLKFTTDITPLKELKHLRHLSLTSIKDFNKLDLTVIGGLVDLESLDLGECSDFPTNFGPEILLKLGKLEKLRLEKGQGDCHTFEILEAVKAMPQLEQLELVNFDVKAGFDAALGACSNLKKLLIIPTYISQSATTNQMVLGAVLRLQKTLTHFVWGVTLELLRVTELFVDQYESPEKKEKKEKKASGSDVIPVLTPVPSINNLNKEVPPAADAPQVEIMPMPNLQKLLLKSLPNTRVKILKIPFHATWRQNITDTDN